MTSNVTGLRDLAGESYRVTGDSAVEVQGHRGVVTFSAGEAILQFKDSKLCISGKDVQFLYLSKDYAQIIGKELRVVKQ